jgi:Helix-turn-helix domain
VNTGTWIEFSLLEKFEGDFLIAAIYSEIQYLDSVAKKEKWHEDENGRCWFYRTQKNLAERYLCNEKTIQRALIKLAQLDLVESKRIGFDQKKYMRIKEAEKRTKCPPDQETKCPPDQETKCPVDLNAQTKKKENTEILRISSRSENSERFQRHENEEFASEKNSHSQSGKNDVEKTNKLSSIENKAPNALTTERKEVDQGELSTIVKKRRSELKKAPEEYSEGTQLFMHYVERYSHRYRVILQRDKMASKHCKRVLEYCSNDLELAKLTVDAYLKSNDSWHAGHLLSKLVQETVLEAMRNRALGAQLMTAKQAQRVEKDAYETLVTKTIVDQIESGEYTSDFFSEEELKRLDEATAKKRAEIMERMQIKENSLEKGLML